MFPNPELVSPVPVHKLMVRDNRFIDIELKQDGAEAFHALNLRQGDIIKLSAPVLEPEPTALVLDRPTRGGFVLTVRPEGLYGEEGKIITRQSLSGSKFTVLGGRGAAKSGEFTVHRGFSLDETGLLKLHFAHGSQINKLMLTKGTDIKIKEKPCGVEEWTVVEAHTENLDRCPNCRTGGGPREFNAADLCPAGTQWALVQPTRSGNAGVALYAEKQLALTRPPTVRLAARPEPR